MLRFLWTSPVMVIVLALAAKTQAGFFPVTDIGFSESGDEITLDDVTANGVKYDSFREVSAGRPPEAGGDSEWEWVNHVELDDGFEPDYLLGLDLGRGHGGGELGKSLTVWFDEAINDGPNADIVILETVGTDDPDGEEVDDAALFGVDTFEVDFLDSGGSVIGSVLVEGGYRREVVIGYADGDWRSNGAGGVVIDLADVSGGSPLNGVFGVRIHDGTGVDPVVIAGLIPEPATLGLLTVGLPAMIRRRR